MPNFEFRCKTCGDNYEFLTAFDKTGRYSKVICPQCGSKKKERLISAPSFAFAQPEGTDRWNSESGGHGYRFEHNKPKVKAERAMAEAMSHMGTDPYGSWDDIEMDTGIHDAETRKGLS